MIEYFLYLYLYGAGDGIGSVPVFPGNGQSLFLEKSSLGNIEYENHDIAIAMSSSQADPVLGLNILQG